MSDNDQFPRGKLCADDEGQLKIAIGVTDKTVVIDFGKGVEWIGMDYEMATQLAGNILKHAKTIAPPEPEKTCDLCDDQGPLLLHARCHLTAPLQVELDGDMLIVRCYLPNCRREVARFQIHRKVEA